MRKVVLVIVLLALCLSVLPGSTAQAAEAKHGAVVLSVVMPGTGEWLNRDFQGGFPLVECVAGYICCFIQMSSALDAAAGDQSDKVRIDFWSKPTAGK